MICDYCQTVSPKMIVLILWIRRAPIKFYPTDVGDMLTRFFLLFCH